jgi:hypothetical protein
MIPLSRLLVASLCLHTCGCSPLEAVGWGLTGAGVVTYDERMAQKRESEATERCKKKHPGVPDECPKWDMECEARVEDFDKCVKRVVKELPVEDEAIERCEKTHPGVPDECPKGARDCEKKVDEFNKCVNREVKKLSSEEDE